MIRKNLTKRIAVSTALLIAAVAFRPSEVKANPAALAAPAACATGVGCILVGSAVVGGVLVYIWQNRSTGQRYRVRAVSGYDATQTTGSRKRLPGEGQSYIPGVAGAPSQPGTRETVNGCLRKNAGLPRPRWSYKPPAYGDKSKLGYCYARF